MTKGEEITAAIVAKLEGVGGLQAVYDSRILESAKDKTLYAVVTETGEGASQPAGQRLTPLAVNTQVIVAIIAAGGDSDEIRFEASAISLLRSAQAAVEAKLLTANQNLGGIIERLNYTGAGITARSEGEQISIVRELRFDALWYRDLPVENDEY